MYRAIFSLFGFLVFLASHDICLGQEPVAAPHAQADFRADKNQIVVTPAAGFHINLAAPNKIKFAQKKEQKPLAITEKSAVFSWSAKMGAAQTQVYVCDDGLKLCEQLKHTWPQAGPELSGQHSGQASSQGVGAFEERGEKAHAKKNDLSKELALCKKQRLKNHILLSFSARWCPGCMRMKAEVWPSTEVKKELQHFQLVPLDSDRFDTVAVMEHYAVAAIPTSLVLDCAGEELTRLVDYAPPKEFAQYLRTSRDPKFAPRSALISKANSGDESAALSLGRRSAEAAAYKDALIWFEKAPSAKKELLYWAARINQDDLAWTEKSTEETRQALLKSLAEGINSFGETPSSLDWRLRKAEVLGESKSEERNQMLEGVVKFCDSVLLDEKKMADFKSAEPFGDYLGFELLKVHESKAEALDELGKKAEAALAWQAGAEAGVKLGIQDKAYGPFFRYLIFLKKTGQFERIERFFAKSLAAQPGDPELLRRDAKYEYDRGHYQQALSLAQQAAPKSFDRNEVWVAVIYANSLGKLGQNKQAREHLLKYLARSDLSPRSKNDISSALAKIP